MQIVKSCGAVVFTRESGQVHFLVIRTVSGDHGFPKGHVQPNESEKETAQREIFEEVGLKVRFLEGFREELFYPLHRKPGCTKNSVYYLAEYAQQTPVCQEEEVSAAFLMPYEQAMQTIAFADLKEVLCKANQFLQECV